MQQGHIPGDNGTSTSVAAENWSASQAKPPPAEIVPFQLDVISGNAYAGSGQSLRPRHVLPPLPRWFYDAVEEGRELAGENVTINIDALMPKRPLERCDSRGDVEYAFAEPPPRGPYAGSSSAPATNPGSVVDNTVNASTIVQPPHDVNSAGLVDLDPASPPCTFKVNGLLS